MTTQTTSPKVSDRLAPEISYQLEIEIGKPIQIQVGRLGRFMFPAGRYVYTGSAKRNLEARIERHLRQEKRLHWHIDWLLAEPGVNVVAVRRSREDECVLNQRVAGTIVASGFGSSDCHESCGSHLRYLETAPVPSKP
jgi:Uri superfamily endonuclease